MANEVVSRNMTYAAITLFLVTAILLLHTSSQRNGLVKDAVALRDHVTKLNLIVSRLKEELEGPSGCKAQVGACLCHTRYSCDYPYWIHI